jgi:L-ribulose-5-phosphate 4-epimerase
MLNALRDDVCKANRDLMNAGLVTLTWGNVSGFDRRHGLMVIKPSGVPYDLLEPEQMVVVNLEGEVIEGDLNPSSDTPTHLMLYRHFGQIGGITHTHSQYATMFAQARKAIPCLGTTHADHFYGPVPVTRPLTEAEVAENYEMHTGRVILECFNQRDPKAVPAVLAAGHGPFTWGNNADDSVRNAIALEAVAEMVLGTWSLDRNAMELEPFLLEKHYQRKHGPDATYGQK